MPNLEDIVCLIERSIGLYEQSRFIALVEDYDRNVELMDIANNSAGASTAQFATQLTGLQASLNRLQSAWEGLYTSWDEASVFIPAVINGLSNIVSMFGEMGAGLTSLTGLLGFFAVKVSLGASLTLKDAAAKAVDAGATVTLGAAMKLATGGVKTFTSAMLKAAITTLAAAAPVVAIVAAIAVLVGGIALLATAEERHHKAAVKAVDDANAASAAASQEAKSIKSLSNEYEKAYKSGEDLVDIKQKIIDKYPELTSALEDENQGYETVINTLDEYIKKQEHLASLEAGKAFVKKREAYNPDDTASDALSEKLSSYKGESKIATPEYQIASTYISLEKSIRAGDEEMVAYWNNRLEEMWKENSDAAEKVTKEFVPMISDAFEKAYSESKKTLLSDREKWAQDIINNSGLSGDGAKKLISMQIYGIDAEDFDAETGALVDDYIKKIADGYNQIAPEIEKLKKSTKGTSDESILTDFINGNLSSLSQNDWSRLDELTKGKITELFGDIRQGWDDNRKILSQQLAASGFVDQEAIAGMSNEMISKVAKAFSDADPGPAQKALQEYYKKVFSKGFSVSSREGTDITGLLQNLDLSNFDAVYDILNEINLETKNGAETFSLLSQAVDFTSLSFDKMDSSMSSYASTFASLKSAVSDGMGMDELSQMLIGLDMTLNDVSYSFDIQTGKVKLSAESAVDLANKERLLTIAQNEQTIATNEQAISVLKNNNAILQSASDKIKTQAKTLTANEMVVKSTDVLTASEAQLVEVITGSTPAWEAFSSKLGATAGDMLDLASQIDSSIGSNNKQIDTLTNTNTVLGQVNDEYKKTKISVDDFSSSTGSSTKSLTAEQKALQANIDALKAQQDAIKEQQRPYESMITALEREIEDREYQIDLLEREKDARQKNIDKIKKERDALNDKLDDEKSAEEARIDAAIRRLKAMEELVDVGLDADAPEYQNKTIAELEEIAKAAKNAAKEQEDLMAVEKAREALENAKKQKTMRVFYADRGWVWEADQKAVQEAQDNLDSVIADQQETEKDKKKQDLEDLIAAYEKAKDDIGLTIQEKQNIEKLDNEFASMNYADMIADLKTYVTDRVPYYQAMNQQVADYDTKIYELTADVDTLTKQIDALTDANQTLKNKIKDIEHDYLNPLKQAYDDLGIQVDSLQKKYDALTKSIEAAAAAQSKLGGGGGGGGGGAPAYAVTENGKVVYSGNDLAEANKHWKWAKQSERNGGTASKTGFEKGGLVDYTGPAVVHGSKSRPEMVLNNSQAAALFNLLANRASVPASISKMPSNSITNNSSSSSETTYFKNCKIYVTSEADSIDALIKDMESKAPIVTRV